MKKVKTVFVAGMILLVTNSFGQSTEQDSEENQNHKKTANTYLDLMVNVVSTNINYGGANSSLKDFKKTDKGIQAGLSFQAGITSSFSLVTELYYVRKGGKLKAGNPFSANESSLRLKTLELPVLARLHLGKVYLNAGPSIAYNFSGKQKINDVSTKLNFNHSAEGFKRFDAGIQMGGGLEFPFKQKRIALDIRYNHGLTNIARKDEVHNRALMISVYFSKRWKNNPLAKK